MLVRLVNRPAVPRTHGVLVMLSMYPMAPPARMGINVLNLILVSREPAQEVALLLAQPVISVIRQGLAMQRPELARIQ